MKEITCRCGKSKKRFKFDVGPFFINTCCEEAGYDVYGNLPEGVEDPNPLEQELKLATQDMDDSRLMGKLPAVDTTPDAPISEMPKDEDLENAAKKNAENFGVDEQLTKTLAELKKQLEELTLKELKKLAKDQGQKGYSTKTKDQLIEMLLEG